MQSSAARMLSALSNSNPPSEMEEQALLLDNESSDDLLEIDDETNDVIIHIGCQEEIRPEVVIDTPSTPAPDDSSFSSVEDRKYHPVLKPFLYQDIEKCLTILNQAQATISQTNNKNTKLYFIYTSLFLFNVAAGIASPVTMFKLMCAASENVHRHLLTVWHKELNEFTLRLHDKKDRLDELIRLDELKDSHWKTWLGVEGSLHCEWVEDANGIHKFWEWYQDKCFFEKNHLTHPVDQCNAIAAQSCEIAKKYPRLSQDIELINNTYHRFNNTINYLNDKINEPWHLSLDTLEPITFWLTFGVGMIAVIGLLIYSLDYYTTRYDYHAALNHANSLGINHIKNPDDADFIRRLALRLNINLEYSSIANLIQQFEEKIKNSRMRFTFLCGAERTEASNHHFLQKDGAHDITRKIFEYAQLTTERASESPKMNA